MLLHKQCYSVLKISRETQKRLHKLSSISKQLTTAVIGFHSHNCSSNDLLCQFWPVQTKSNQNGDNSGLRLVLTGDCVVQAVEAVWYHLIETCTTYGKHYPCKKSETILAKPTSCYEWWLCGPGSVAAVVLPPAGVSHKPNTPHLICAQWRTLLSSLCRLWAVHCVFCTVHCALFTIHCVFFTVHCAKCIMHRALCDMMHRVILPSHVCTVTLWLALQPECHPPPLICCTAPWGLVQFTMYHCNAIHVCTVLHFDDCLPFSIEILCCMAMENTQDCALFFNKKKTIVLIGPQTALCWPKLSTFQCI